jgi:hydroxymethylbilane synthase
VVSRISLRIGTRGSDLALAQTKLVIARLQEVNPRVAAAPVVIATAGDRIKDAASLRKAGTGVFVKELERALMARKIDAAVHSLKDMPTTLPAGLEIAAILEREEPADAFVGRGTVPIEQLPRGSVIGTSSPRRQALLQAAYPHLRVEELRGNLDSRLQKLRDPRSSLAGIVVAAAGLRRLRGATGVPHQALPKDRLVPAAGQGALAVEIRSGDARTKALFAPLHDEKAAAETSAERELVRRLEGGCQAPLGAWAQAGDDGLLRLLCALANPDGSDLIRGEATGLVESPLEVAAALETMMRSRGAEEILASLQPRRLKPARNGHKKKRPAPRAKRSKSRR